MGRLQPSTVHVVQHYHDASVMLGGCCSCMQGQLVLGPSPEDCSIAVGFFLAAVLSHMHAVCTPCCECAFLMSNCTDCVGQSGSPAISADVL